MIIPGRNRYKLKISTNHTNYISNGTIVPSVTTVIDVISKKNLMQWANSLGWKKKSLQRELDRTAQIGTYAHNYCEAILHNDSISMNTINNSIVLLDPDDYRETMNAIQSFTMWYLNNKNRIKILNTELEMCTTFYGGTCDILCEFDGKLCILDLKTSSAFHPTQFLQLSAYAKAYQDIFHQEIETVGVLRLNKKDGRIADLKFIEDIPSGDIDYYYSVFEVALNLYHSMNILNTDFGE